MKKHAVGIALILALIFGLASLGLASIVWKTNAIPRMNVSLSYIDPTTGSKVLRNYSGVGLNYLEINQDVSNNYHYVVLHTENFSNMKVELSTVGGGLSSAAAGTQINGTWREGLNPNVVSFGGIPAEMVVDDIRAVILNGTYLVDTMNASTPTITMTVAGLLTVGGSERTPAKVTVTASAKGIPSAYSNVTSIIGRGFIAPPPSASGPPVASNISQDLPFGAAAPNIDVIAGSPGFSGPLTADIPSGGDALNGHVTLSSSSPNNTVIYTPNEGFSGKDTFQYRLISGTLHSDNATVTVNVGPRPKAYAALQNFTSMTKDTNAKDFAPVADWDSNFTMSVPAKSDEGGNISINAGQFRYKPLAGFDGTDTVTYTLTDKLSKTITGTAIFEVVPHAVGDSFDYPIAAPGIATATLLGNDRGSGLSVVDVLKIGTSNGTPTLSSGNITYAPFSTGGTHKEYFAYTIKDSAGRMSSATVTINFP